MKLYDPALVKLVVCGVTIVGGFAKGSFIEVSQSANDYIKIIGVDGQGTRIRTEDTSGSIRIRLMQTSNASSALSVIRLTDNYSPNGQGVGPTSITDLNGQTFYFAARSWLAKPPDADFADKAGERTWTIETDEFAQFLGGANFV